jgi:hypothetical protein
MIVDPRQRECLWVARRRASSQLSRLAAEPSTGNLAVFRSSLRAIAASSSHLLKDVISNRTSFGCQKDLATAGIDWVRLYCYEAKAGATISRSVADVAQISRHREATDPDRAGVIADPFALIKSDHQESGHKRKWNRAT